MNELVSGGNEQDLSLVRFSREMRGRSILDAGNALEGIESVMAGRKGKPS